MTENGVSSKSTKKRNKSCLNKVHIKNQPDTKETPDTLVDKEKMTKSRVNGAGTG